MSAHRCGGLDGRVSGVRATMDANVEQQTFLRAPDRHLRDAVYIARFVGSFQRAIGAPITVQQQDGKLIITVPGQRPYELLPRRNNSFDLKNVRGFSVQFPMDASGKVLELVTKQPNGIAVATRR